MTVLEGSYTRLTDQVRERFLTAIYPQGADNDLACEHAGVSRGTFYRWQARGRKVLAAREAADLQGEPRPPESEFDTYVADFIAAVERARADAEIAALTIIQAAARTDWKAAAWYLERTRKSKYARPGGVEVAVNVPAPDGGEVTVTVGRTDPSADELARTLVALGEVGFFDAIDTTATDADDEPDD